MGINIFFSVSLESLRENFVKYLCFVASILFAVEEDK